MTELQKQRNFLIPTVILILSLTGIGLLFYITCRWDNKYAPQEGSSVTVLADGWEFYPDYALLSGDTVKDKLPSAPYLITIGQSGSFSSYHSNGSPFGTALYRKQLYLEPSSEGWLLELPEIFSACKIYVNGELVQSYGSLPHDGYRIYIKNTLIPLPSGEVELLIQASNYSHYYSGMVYPPLLGEADTITRLVTCRLIFYAFLCFFTLGCAVVSFTVWFHKQPDSLYIAYGFLCLAFAIHIAYPLLHWTCGSAGVLPYVVEDTSYFVMLTCMAALTYRLCQTTWPRPVSIAGYIFSIGMALLPTAALYVLFPLFPHFVSLYGSIMGAGKVIMSVYLIVTSFVGAFNSSRHIWLLCGNAVFGFGILFDYISAGRFEPIRFGWQTEYCGFVMVLLFMALMLSYNKKALDERRYLTEHLQDEVACKTAHLSSMLEERRQFLSAVAHDLKAPMAAINTYIDYIRDSGTPIDEELNHYLDIIDHKSTQMQDNVKSLQIFHENDSGKEQACILDISEFLRYVYEETLPYADANGIYYHLELPDKTAHIYGKKGSLFRAFENLVINATEHTPLEGTIMLCVKYHHDYAEITLTDSGNGISPEDLEHIFHYGHSTKESKGLCGLGLYFAKTSIEECGGRIDVQSRVGQYTAFCITFPLSAHD